MNDKEVILIRVIITIITIFIQDTICPRPHHSQHPFPFFSLIANSLCCHPSHYVSAPPPSLLSHRQTKNGESQSQCDHDRDGG